MIKMSLLIKV